MDNNLVWLVISIFVGLLILGVLKRLWIGVAMNIFGWKPRILDEKVMGITVKECTASFIEQCRKLRPEQFECVDEEEIQMMQVDMEIYTRFVIDSYVQNYLMSK